jgi:hypothetical protein
MWTELAPVVTTTLTNVESGITLLDNTTRKNVYVIVTEERLGEHKGKRYLEIRACNGHGNKEYTFSGYMTTAQIRALGESLLANI